MSLTPHGGKLVNVMREGDALVALQKEAEGLPSLQLSSRQLCDAECILNGAFSPLEGFLTEEEYNGVVNNMRLPSGIVWPMTNCLELDDDKAATINVGDRIALRDNEMRIIAVMNVSSKYTPNKALECEKVFGSPDDVCHPAIKVCLEEVGNTYIGGKLEGITLPVHYDFTEYRLSPNEIRAKIKRQNILRLVGFQTRNPMHRSHRELTLLAARDAKANVLIHPVVGMTKPGDVDHFTRVRCYIELIKTYPAGMAMLSLLPIAMRMAGPREAVWHAIIRKNYGCTHFVVGRDHAGPGKNRDKKDFYDPYAAQQLVESVQEELKITVLKYKMVVYVEELGDYRQIDQVPEGMRSLGISGTELRRRLFKGIEIPAWFSFPEVVKILRQSYPPCKAQGFTVFLSGLSGSGKTTIANALHSALLEDGGRPVTLLDGDHVRKELSAELGFSHEDRDKNIRRVGYVASLVTKSRGACIVSSIAPFQNVREEVRSLVKATGGGFVEVHLSTPIKVCEERDHSGFYKKARSGEIKQVAGIDLPYEDSPTAELTIDTTNISVKQAVHEIILHLESEGFLGGV